MKKEKIVWLCHMANKEIADLLEIDSAIIVSPWMTDFINIFRGKEEIELEVISPNYYNNKRETIKIDNITIHLYKYKSNFLPKRAYNFSYNYKNIQKRVGNIVKKINPDLIHLFGSENPLYASGIIPLLDKYPTLVSLQGFVKLSSKENNIIRNFIRWNRIRIEKKINSRASFFTVVSNDMVTELKKDNRSSKIYKNYFPTTVPNVSSNNYPNKEFDIVYYAKISKNKGIEDLLEALKIIKRSRPSIKAIIIGGGNKSYITYIKSLIEEFNLKNNITFAGFQPTQQDVFKLAVKAKVYVLPTYFDALPGSLREAMFMKISVIAYAVGGIPELNKEVECINLVEKRNIEGLVEKINKVLDNTSETNKMTEKAYGVITSKYSNESIYDNLINTYNEILK